MSLTIGQILSPEKDATSEMEKLGKSFPRRTVGETVLLEGKRKWKMSFLQLDSSFPSNKIFCWDYTFSIFYIRSVGFSFEVLRLRIVESA